MITGREKESVERFIATVRDHRHLLDHQSLPYLGIDQARAVVRALKDAGYKEDTS